MNFKEQALPKIIYAVFFVVFFGGYYFSIISGSEHSSLLRIIIAVGILLFFLLQRKALRNITFFRVDSLLKVVFFLYIGYLLALSLFYEDWKSIRRVLYILLMVFFIYSFSKDLRLKVDRFIVFIPFLAAFIGGAYLCSYYSANGFNIDYKDSAISSTQLGFLADYGNPIIAGLYLSFLVPFCLWSYFNNKNRIISCLYYISIFLILFAVFLTFARTAWLASIISVSVFLLFGIFDKKIKKVLLLILPFIVAASYYLFYFISYDFERGVTYRDQIWIEFVSSISGLQQWLFGRGLDQALDFVKLPDGSIAVHSHSIYVETLYLTGLVGLFLMCAVLYISIYNLFKSIRNDQNVLWFSILISLACSMFFDYYNLVHSPNVMWLWFWFPISISLACIRRADKLTCSN